MIAGYFQLICTQKVEEFTAPVAGEYKLECWGAQGSNFAYGSLKLYGGKGGYARGMYTMNKGKSIYICVGGNKNGYNNKIPNVGDASFMCGGGATSITTTDKGVLSNFNSCRNEVLLVAGGGGAQDSGEGSTPIAGVGGGSEGGDASYSGSRGTGARQNQPGTNILSAPQNCPHNYQADFGYGGVASVLGSTWEDFGAQGGGGYYGGGGAQQVGPGGGGSAYMNPILKSAKTISGNKLMPNPQGGSDVIGHLGDGACIVTQISF